MTDAEDALADLLGGVDRVMWILARLFGRGDGRRGRQVRRAQDLDAAH